jgi:hypothetical protein
MCVRNRYNPNYFQINFQDMYENRAQKLCRRFYLPNIIIINLIILKFLQIILLKTNYKCYLLLKTQKFKITLVHCSLT